jgi:bacterioferritin-associated ferredoxin
VPTIFILLANLLHDYSVKCANCLCYGICLNTVQAGGKVVGFADLPGVLARLSGMAAQLDACQRALADFLEEKRAAFPRCGRHVT